MKKQRCKLVTKVIALTLAICLLVLVGCGKQSSSKDEINTVNPLPDVESATDISQTLIEEKTRWENQQESFELEQLIIRAFYDDYGDKEKCYILEGETKSFRLTNKREGYLYDKRSDERVLLYENVDILNNTFRNCKDMCTDIIPTAYYTICIMNDISDNDKWFEISQFGSWYHSPIPYTEEIADILKTGTVMSDFSEEASYVFKETEKGFSLVLLPILGGQQDREEIEIVSIECDAVQDFGSSRGGIYYVKDGDVYCIEPCKFETEGTLIKGESNAIALLAWDACPVVVFEDGSTSWSWDNFNMTPEELENVSDDHIIWKR